MTMLRLITRVSSITTFNMDSYTAQSLLDDFQSEVPHRYFIPKMTSEVFRKSVPSATESRQKKRVHYFCTNTIAFSPKASFFKNFF